MLFWVGLHRLGDAQNETAGPVGDRRPSSQKQMRLSVPFAAGGVAKFVNCLRAKRAGDFVRDYRDSEAVRDSGTKHLRLQDSVNSIFKEGTAVTQAPA